MLIFLGVMENLNSFDLELADCAEAEYVTIHHIIAVFCTK